MENSIATSISEKIAETIRLTIHLIGAVPKEKLDWRPIPTASKVQPMDLGSLLGHLLDCVAGFCAVFNKAFPQETPALARLRSEQVNHSCEPDEARIRLQIYAEHIAQSFKFCTDADLARAIKTVFAPDGETLMTLLLGNLEHLLNHKYQLFFYLKLLGVPVGSADLYQFRGIPEGERST